MVERSPPGALIVLEGIDGAGKTTQVRLLAGLLTALGESVVVSKEPTDSEWGRRIRSSAIRGRMSLREELRAFIEDRRLHVATVIRPALDDGAIVVLDRYYLSTIAYQGSRGGDAAGVEAQMREFPAPTLAVVLDIEARLGLRRVAARDGMPNHFEREDELERAREIFRSLAGRRTAVIDGGLPIEQVHALIRERVFAPGGPLQEVRCAKRGGCEDVERCAERLAGRCTWARLRERALAREEP